MGQAEVQEVLLQGAGCLGHEARRGLTTEGELLRRYRRPCVYVSVCVSDVCTCVCVCVCACACAYMCECTWAS